MRRARERARAANEQRSSSSASGRPLRNAPTLGREAKARPESAVGAVGAVGAGATSGADTAYCRGLQACDVGPLGAVPSSSRRKAIHQPAHSQTRGAKWQRHGTRPSERLYGRASLRGAEGSAAGDRKTWSERRDNHQPALPSRTQQDDATAQPRACGWRMLWRRTPGRSSGRANSRQRSSGAGSAGSAGRGGAADCGGVRRGSGAGSAGRGGAADC
jgi:hypothetical protein